MDFRLSSFNSFHLSLSLMAGPLISFLSSFLAVSCELLAFIIKEMDSSFKCSVFPGCHWFPWIKVTIIPIQWYDFFLYIHASSASSTLSWNVFSSVSQQWLWLPACWYFRYSWQSLYYSSSDLSRDTQASLSFTLYWETIMANFNGYYTCTSSFVAYFDH